MTDKQWREILEHEFSGSDHSFIIQMRCDMTWDKQAFTRLAKAMEQCCAELEGAEQVDRRLADGFWYYSWFVESWTTHPNYPREHSEQYYRDA